MTNRFGSIKGGLRHYLSPMSIAASIIVVIMQFPAQEPAYASGDRSSARVDIIISGNGIVRPQVGAGYSILLRADETGTLSSGSLEVFLTENSLTSDDQIRRFIGGSSSPVMTEIENIDSPEVPQLESREVLLDLSPEVLANTGPWENNQNSTKIYGLEVRYMNPGNLIPELRKLTGRQLVILSTEPGNIGSALIAPIVSLTATASGGQPLNPDELQALTIEGGALNEVTSAVRKFPATIAIDSRITSSIAILQDQAPPESLLWSSGLGSVGLAQFALPWADADPLATLAIDTLVYAKLGEYPWIHGNAISNEELATLSTRSASAILLSSDSLPTDRAVTTIGNARVLRIDSQLSSLAKDALQAPTELEAQADLQRAQGLIASRAVAGNEEILIFSTGRLPATGIAPRISYVLESFANMPVASTISVPLELAPSERLPGVSPNLQSREWQRFVSEVKKIWESDVAFATIASDPGTTIYSRWNRYQALLSSAWAEDPNGLATEWRQAQEESRRFQNSVRIEQGSSITVLSDQTQLPIALSNDLETPVVVTLEVQPTTGILAVEEPLIKVEIEASSSRTVVVPVQSLANGTVPVQFTLSSVYGEPIGQDVTIPVTIRAGWEGVISVGLAMLIGGIFTFGIFRALQRRRATRISSDD